MPFVKRDAKGQIASIHREQEAPDLLYLQPSHPEVLAFVSDNDQSGPVGRGELLKSDLDTIRVFEDLADVLINKRVVVLTDFPAAAQEKLMRRKRLRSSLSPITDALGITEDDQGALP